MAIRRYQWEILQPGGLPLRPNHQVDARAIHICTSLLLWGENEMQTPTNTLITDPCFLGPHVPDLVRRLQSIGMTLPDIGHFFVTHPHHDHMPQMNMLLRLTGMAFQPDLPGFADLHKVACPGHDRHLQALTFRDTQDQEIWIVGDAILDQDWLLQWQYYYPNRYEREAIIETWRSVAKICASADRIIPGHGGIIEVSEVLIRCLLDRFPQAQYAKDCPEVAEILKTRLEHGKRF